MLPGDPSEESAARQQRIDDVVQTIAIVTGVCIIGALVGYGIYQDRHHLLDDTFNDR